MGEQGNGNGTASPGELQRWLHRVDREQRQQWGEIRSMSTSVTSIEAKLDQLLERRHQSRDENQQGAAGERFEQMYGVWRFAGQAIATAVPAGLTAGILLIAYLEYAS